MRKFHRTRWLRLGRDSRDKSGQTGSELLEADQERQQLETNLVLCEATLGIHCRRPVSARLGLHSARGTMQEDVNHLHPSRWLAIELLKRYIGRKVPPILGTELALQAGSVRQPQLLSQLPRVVQDGALVCIHLSHLTPGQLAYTTGTEPLVGGYLFHQPVTRSNPLKAKHTHLHI
jgi:hypothetical protein